MPIRASSCSSQATSSNTTLTLLSQSYLSAYRAHLADTKSHLVGHITTEDSDTDASLVGSSTTTSSSTSRSCSPSTSTLVTTTDTPRPPPPTCWFAPYWTLAEKDRFFHALSVHSTLRPDLIAACVRTKTLVDVCVYIDELRAASATNSVSTNTNKTNGHTSTSSALRRDLPCAMAVSDEWIAWEEAQAQILAEIEPEWEAAAEEEMRAKTRPHDDSDADEDEEGTLTVQWKREDMLKQLGEVELGVMHALVREAEDAETAATAAALFLRDAGPRKRKRGDGDDEDGDGDGGDDDDGDRARDGGRDQDRDQGDVGGSCAAETPTIATTHALRHEQGKSGGALPQPQAHPVTVPPAQIPPDSDSDLNHSNLDGSGALDSEAEADPDPDPDSVDLEALSPAERRQYQKRLYMRRKRAVKTGTAVAEGVARLKPGRHKVERMPKVRAVHYQSRKKKPKGRRARKQCEVGKEGVGVEKKKQEDKQECGERHQREDLVMYEEDREPSLNEGGGGERHPHIGGPTTHYRIKSEFERIGVDGTFLRAEGFGLLNLRGLGRIMRLPISGQTIRLWNAAVVQFVSKVVRRVVVARAEEEKRKSQSKVWHVSKDSIRWKSVAEVLDMMEDDEIYGGVFWTGEVKDDADADEGEDEGWIESEEELDRKDVEQEIRYQEQLWKHEM